MNPITVRRSMIIATTCATLVLSGCSAAATPLATPAETPAASASYPLTVDNCGTNVTVTAAPKRIVSIKSSATELLLALGLGDRIVGSAFLDGPLPESLAPAGAGLNVISDFLPGQEAVLGLNPDFIYGGWESNFSADGVGDRNALAALGVGSYVSPAACKGDFMPNPLTFDSVFTEIDEAGKIFGAEPAATKLVRTLQDDLAGLTPSTAQTTTALWYSSGTTSPYVGAGIGSPEMIMEAAGLTNIFADVSDTWTSVGWESIIAANPSVIVLVDATWNTAASKIAQLESDPATRVLDAVKNQRYIILPFAATEAGIRNVEAAASTITQLAELNE
ncbi:MAG: putative F420-0 ABC transporter substrate-binding protein [Cryobacterium sp.]|uniref:putative F420-0 ABC transporter substrate-binding protein n=1 Tax=unclassified Cryobacterium TaxID=2649013 RepID=UPI001A2629BC|nr:MULTISPECIES: putative F420-0 ABC transporter substrate-binding protein [unclassified Cryobacterium]MCY7404657.1 putative F420-0 ABC transporter substrate-binding protein [Cryobacterium sp.]MEC5154985.1 iron complex transport system substrate-binding protein [Cryobacterium sp. CAN_C3]